MTRRLARKAVIVLTAIICIFYLVYRGLYTLNLGTGYAIFASLLLYAAEAYGVVIVLLFFLQVWDTYEPPQQPILHNRTVDVFVPTYNEDPELLRTTLQACQRMPYPHRTYLCDDGGTAARTNDPEKGPAARERAAKIKSICAELDVTYVARPDNRHAKAGNLNYAFERTFGEFIIIFDADHVPEPHFIARLIGYFADEKLAFVQTPHAFYNFESFQSCHDHGKNIYWEDGQLFYRVIQPGRNRWNAPIFAGSAAMFRRKALAEVGYIATETITEDMHTGLRMHAKGWTSLGVSERLIAGQAAPDVTTFHTQRLRWGEGNLSIIAHNNPLTTPGLSIGQRLCYLGSMIHWAGGIFKLGIYFTPLLMLLTGVPPVNQFTWTLFCIMAVYIFASVFGVKYISNGQGSFWRNELFTMIGFWTQIRGTMRALFWRKMSKFVVTSKRGRQSNSIWPYVQPHFYFVALSVLALFWGWGKVIFSISTDFYKPILATCWTIFHLSLAVTCIRRSLWPEDRRYSYRHTVHLPVEYGANGMNSTERDGLGCTVDLSENGLGAIAYQPIPLGAALRLRVHGTGEVLDVLGTVVRCVEMTRGRKDADQQGGYRIGVKLQEMSSEQFDILNRIVMHYAVPRLYEQYRSPNPNLFWRSLSRFSWGLVLRRHSVREPYRLPFMMAMSADEAPTFSTTEDISREAMIALFTENFLPGTICEFRIYTPVGELQGMAEVLRSEPRVYAAKKFYRIVLGFTHFEEQGRVILEDLLGHADKRVHRQSLMPMKKKLAVPMGKRSLLSVAALVPFLAVTVITFRIVYRDDFFLRDMIASPEAVSGVDYERLERVYAATVQEKHPSTDRLVLLTHALVKAGRETDVDRIVAILAPRDRRNLDLQIAKANTFLHSKDYSRARFEYENLLREFQGGRLPPEKKREMRLALARSTFHSGDIDEAALLFKELIRESPGDLGLRYEFAGALVASRQYQNAALVYEGSTPDRKGRLLLATVHALLDKPDEAEEQCNLVLRDDPDDAEAQLLKADVLNSRNSTVRAEVIYNRLRQINPGDPAVRSRLAFMALKGKNYDRALAMFQQLVDDGSATPADVKGFVDAASGATALGDSHKILALTIAERAQTEWAGDPVYLARLAWVLQRVKEHAISVELLGLAIQMDGKNPELTRQYIAALFDGGQRGRALTLLEAEERTPENRSLLATIYLEQKQYAKAEAECRAVLAQKPNDVTSRKQLADCLSGVGKHDEAVYLLLELVDELPADPNVPVRVAEELLASGEYLSAFVRYVTLLGSSFEQPSCWEGLINAGAGLHFVPPSLMPLIHKIAERAKKGEIVKPEILSRLAFILIENGRADLTPELLDQIVVAKAIDPAVRAEVSGVLARAGRYRDALKMMDGLPSKWQDAFRLISCHAALREWESAEKICWGLLQRNPDDPKAMRWLADLLCWRGEYAGSLEWFANLIQKNPDDVELRIRVAEVIFQRGDVVAAIDKFQALLDKSFELTRVWEGYLAVAASLKSLTPGQTQSIRRIHERFLVASPATDRLRANPLFLARLAGGLSRIDRSKEAEAMFQRAVELVAAKPAERKELARALAISRKYAEAIKLYEGLELDLEDRFVLIELNAAAGNFPQARKGCEGILKDEPGNPRARRALGDVLSWQGEHKESLRVFRELIHDDPNDNDLKIREAEVTLWSKEFAPAQLLFQALPKKTWEMPRVRRGYIDAMAAQNKAADRKITKPLLLAVAERSLSESDELRGDPVFLARLGGLLAHAGEKVAADRALEQAITLAPQDPAMRLELGGALQAAERHKDALEMYDGLKLKADDRFRRVEAHAALRQFDRARDECRDLLRQSPLDRQASLWLADLTAWKGEHAEALRSLGVLAREWPENGDIPLRIAEVTLWSGNSAKALALFQALPEKTLERPRARRSLIDAAAGILDSRGLQLDVARLTVIADRSLAATDDLNSDPIFLSRLGLVLQRGNVPDAVRRVLDRAIALQPKEAAARLELGGSLVAAGRFADAARLYEGLKLDGDNRFRWVELMAAQKDWAGARRAVEAIIERNPDDVAAKIRLTDLLSWKGDHADALRMLEELVRAHPEDADLRVRQALITLWSKDHSKSLALFFALPPKMRERADVRRGLVDAAAGSDAAAVGAADRSIFQKIAELSLANDDALRADAVFLMRLGLVLHRIGDKDLTVRTLARACELAPLEESVRFELAGILAAAGQFAKSAVLYDGLKLEGENRFRRLELFAAQRNWPAALIECRRLTVLDPKDKRAVRWQADILSWKGDYTESIRLFEEMSKADPANEELRIRLTEVTLWSKDHEKSLALLETLPETALKRPDLRRGFIDSASTNDKPLRESSILVGRRIAEFTLAAPAPDEIRSNVSYLARLAWILLKSGDRQTANQLLAVALARKPTEPAERKELGGVMGAAGQVVEAIKLYEGLTLEGEDRFRLIGLHSAAKDFERAEILCRDILRAEADSRKAKRWLADVLSWKGAYEESLRLLGELIRLEPENKELPIRVAEVTLWSKDAVRAIGMFEAILAKSFDQPLVWDGFVASAAIVKEHSESQRKLVRRIRESAERLELKSAVFWSRLGWIAMRAGDEAGAAALLDRALALTLNEENDRREVAGVLSSLKRYKEAAALYGDLALTRKDRFRLAEIHSAAGDFPSAIKHLEFVLKIEPMNKKAIREMADVHSWNKEYAVALTLFDRLLKDDPKNADLRIRIAEVQLWSREADKSLAAFQELIGAESSDPRIWRGFIDSAAAAKKLTAQHSQIAKRIATELETNAEAKPLNQDPAFLSRLVLVLHRTGQVELREQLAPRLVRIAPTSPAVRREIAGIFIAIGANAQARKLYSGIELDDEDRLRLIDLSTAEKQFEEAEKQARALLAASPDNVKIKRKLAAVLIARNNPSEALSLLHAMKKSFVDDESFAAELALATLWSGEYEEALKLLEPLLAKGDNRQIISCYLDAAAMVRKIDPLIHKKMVRGIHEQAAKLKFSAEKMRQLAWIMRKVGEKETAVSILEKLVAAEPDSRDLRIELAQALDDFGKLEEAAKHYRVLLATTPRQP